MQHSNSLSPLVGYEENKVLRIPFFELHSQDFIFSILTKGTNKQEFLS
jgi:hypothetical protein